ncbi:TPA: AbrB family transcriptional regulator, partial [Streptococcus suis]
EGKEFIVYKGIDDVIVLAPKIPNPFDSMEPFVMDNDFEGVVLLDNEG